MSGLVEKIEKLEAELALVRRIVALPLEQTLAEVKRLEPGNTAAACQAIDLWNKLSNAEAGTRINRDLRAEVAKLRQACADLIEHAGEEDRREAAVKEHFGWRDRTCFCDECTVHHNALEAIRFAREALGPATKPDLLRCPDCGNTKGLAESQAEPGRFMCRRCCNDFDGPATAGEGGGA